MTGRYLTDLKDVCSGAGLAVVEVNGWQTRARSSGGYSSGRPTHVMVHHTASQTSAENDVNYICFGADARPLSNLYLARDGGVWICAAGATNTNGSGNDTWGGGVPQDQMNAYAIGIEAGNNGVGEAWPWVQQEAYLTMIEALRSAYSIPINNVRGHLEWAPGRKIDPAGSSRWASGKNSWNMNQFRIDVAAATPEPEPPIPPDPPVPPQGDDMTIKVLESQTTPKEFNAVFFAECDAQGRSIEVQWSGDGNDPRVMQRLQTMDENFGPRQHVLLAGLVNNRLHPKHRPTDIADILHNWTDNDFAP